LASWTTQSTVEASELIVQTTLRWVFVSGTTDVVDGWLLSTVAGVYPLGVGGDSDPGRRRRSNVADDK